MNACNVRSHARQSVGPALHSKAHALASVATKREVETQQALGTDPVDSILNATTEARDVEAEVDTLLGNDLTAAKWARSLTDEDRQHATPAKVGVAFCIDSVRNE